MGRKRKQLPLVSPLSETEDVTILTPIADEETDEKTEVILGYQEEHTQTPTANSDDSDDSDYDAYSSDFANQLFYRYRDSSKDGFVYLLTEVEKQFEAATASATHEKTPPGDDTLLAARRTALHAVREATETYLRHLTDLEAREAAGAFQGQGYETLG